MNKKIPFSLLLIILVFSAKAFACTCGGTSDDRSIRDKWIGLINQSAAVFSGKVVGFAYRKDIRVDHDEERKLKDPEFSYETKVIKFEVDRWWKSGLSPTVYIFSNEIRNSNGTNTVNGCDYSFEKDGTYLVFANGNSSALRASKCSNTTSTKVDWYAQLLEIIGPGTSPDKTKK